MKRLLVVSLGCLLAWFTAAIAQEGEAHLARPAGSAPGVTLGRPQVLSVSDEPAVLSPLIVADAIHLASFGAAAELAPVRPAVVLPEPVAAADLQLAVPPSMSGSAFAAGDVVLASTSSGFAMDAHPVAAQVPVSPVPVPAAVVPVGPRLTDWCCTPGGGADCPGCAPGGAGAVCPGCADCSACCVDCCDCCVSPHEWYFRAEYLLWWLRGPSLPVLVTTGTEASQGILGRPGTVVLFGGERESFDPFHGGRFTVGWWCDPCQRWGIETSGFFLGQQTLKFDADSSRFPVLARPFFNINLGVEDAELTAFPDQVTGSVSVRHPTRLWGLETNLRCNPCVCGWLANGTWFAGVRYLDLGEGLSIVENVQVDPDFEPPGPGEAGDAAIVGDEFRTRNQFFGAQIGFEAEWRWDRWLLNIRPKLALGMTHQTITINGFQSVTRDGAVLPFVGGLLALPSNIGRFERNRFSVVPEIGINVGYAITESLTAYVGYTFLFWSNVVRPGDQVDRVLDINQIPNFRPPVAAAPQRRPVVPFKETGFWAQGMNFGLEYRY